MLSYDQSDQWIFWVISALLVVSPVYNFSFVHSEVIQLPKININLSQLEWSRYSHKNTHTDKHTHAHTHTHTDKHTRYFLPSVLMLDWMFAELDVPTLLAATACQYELSSCWTNPCCCYSAPHVMQLCLVCCIRLKGCECVCVCVCVSVWGAVWEQDVNSSQLVLSKIKLLFSEWARILLASAYQLYNAPLAYHIKACEFCVCVCVCV